MTSGAYYVLAGKLTCQLFAGHAGLTVNSVKCEQQGTSVNSGIYDD